MEKSTRIYAALLGTAALVAAACGPTAPTGGEQPPAAAVEKPTPGGRIIEGSFSDIRTLQPILVTDTPSDRIASLMYDRLIQADPNNGEPKPRMAKFTVSADGRTYSYEIDAKAVWRDRKSTRLNSSHSRASRMPSSA